MRSNTARTPGGATSSFSRSGALGTASPATTSRGRAGVSGTGTPPPQPSRAAPQPTGTARRTPAHSTTAAASHARGTGGAADDMMARRKAEIEERLRELREQRSGGAPTAAAASGGGGGRVSPTPLPTTASAAAGSAAAGGDAVIDVVPAYVPPPPPPQQERFYDESAEVIYFDTVAREWALTKKGSNADDEGIAPDDANDDDDSSRWMAVAVGDSVVVADKEKEVEEMERRLIVFQAGLHKLANGQTLPTASLRNRHAEAAANALARMFRVDPIRTVYVGETGKVSKIYSGFTVDAFGLTLPPGLLVEFADGSVKYFSTSYLTPHGAPPAPKGGSKGAAKGGAASSAKKDSTSVGTHGATSAVAAGGASSSSTAAAVDPIMALVEARMKALEARQRAAKEQTSDKAVQQRAEEELTVLSTEGVAGLAGLSTFAKKGGLGAPKKPPTVGAAPPPPATIAAALRKESVHEAAANETDGAEEDKKIIPKAPVEDSPSAAPAPAPAPLCPLPTALDDLYANSALADDAEDRPATIGGVEGECEEELASDGAASDTPEPSRGPPAPAVAEFVEVSTNRFVRDSMSLSPAALAAVRSGISGAEDMTDSGSAAPPVVAAGSTTAVTSHRQNNHSTTDAQVPAVASSPLGVSRLRLQKVASYASIGTPRGVTARPHHRSASSLAGSPHNGENEATGDEGTRSPLAAGGGGSHTHATIAVAMSPDGIVPSRVTAVPRVANPRRVTPQQPHHAAPLGIDVLLGTSQGTNGSAYGGGGGHSDNGDSSAAGFNDTINTQAGAGGGHRDTTDDEVEGDAAGEREDGSYTCTPASSAEANVTTSGAARVSSGRRGSAFANTASSFYNFKDRRRSSVEAHTAEAMAALAAEAAAEAAEKDEDGAPPMPHAGAQQPIPSPLRSNKQQQLLAASSSGDGSASAIAIGIVAMGDQSSAAVVAGGRSPLAAPPAMANNSSGGGEPLRREPTVWLRSDSAYHPNHPANRGSSSHSPIGDSEPPTATEEEAAAVGSAGPSPTGGLLQYYEAFVGPNAAGASDCEHHRMDEYDADEACGEEDGEAEDDTFEAEAAPSPEAEAERLRRQAEEEAALLMLLEGGDVDDLVPNEEPPLVREASPQIISAEAEAIVEGEAEGLLAGEAEEEEVRGAPAPELADDDFASPLLHIAGNSAAPPPAFRFGGRGGPSKREAAAAAPTPMRATVAPTTEEGEDEAACATEEACNAEEEEAPSQLEVSRIEQQLEDEAATLRMFEASEAAAGAEMETELDGPIGPLAGADQQATTPTKYSGAAVAEAAELAPPTDGSVLVASPSDVRSAASPASPFAATLPRTHSPSLRLGRRNSRGVGMGLGLGGMGERSLLGSSNDARHLTSSALLSPNSLAAAAAAAGEEGGGGGGGGVVSGGPKSPAAVASLRGSPAPQQQLSSGGSGGGGGVAASPAVLSDGEVDASTPVVVESIEAVDFGASVPLPPLATIGMATAAVSKALEPSYSEPCDDEVPVAKASSPSAPAAATSLTKLDVSALSAPQEKPRPAGKPAPAGIALMKAERLAAEAAAANAAAPAAATPTSVPAFVPPLASSASTAAAEPPAPLGSTRPPVLPQRLASASAADSVASSPAHVASPRPGLTARHPSSSALLSTLSTPRVPQTPGRGRITNVIEYAVAQHHEKTLQRNGSQLSQAMLNSSAVSVHSAASSSAVGAVAGGETKAATAAVSTAAFGRVVVEEQTATAPVGASSSSADPLSSVAAKSQAPSPASPVRGAADVPTLAQPAVGGGASPSKELAVDGHLSLSCFDPNSPHMQRPSAIPRGGKGPIVFAKGRGGMVPTVTPYVAKHTRSAHVSAIPAAAPEGYRSRFA